MIVGIVLAAGESRRMGSPKALLKIGEKTFVQHVHDVLTDTLKVEKVVIVLGAEHRKVIKELQWFKGVTTLNTEFKKGQLSSIVTGINAIKKDKPDAAFVCPVDQPLFSSRLIEKMIDVFHESKKLIVVPTHNGKHGHPVLFSSLLFPELSRAPQDVGARFVLHHHRDNVVEVETDEEGVLISIDTPDDYQKYIKGPSS
jgi:molybdenum cofactor cytidylyltransferase